MSKSGVRKPGIWLTVGLLVAAAAVLLAVMLPKQSEPAVATLDGHAITEAELTFHMSRLERQVRSELRSQHQWALGQGEWESERDGVQPLRLLRERALDAALQDKALLAVAEQQQLIDETDFSSIVRRMEQDNRSRAAASARGEVVYGLQRFTLASYYPHLMTALRTGVKRELSQREGDPLHLPREEVEAYFDAHRSEWSVNGTSYRVTRLLIPAAQADKAAVLAEASRMVEDGSELAALQSRYAGAELSEQTLAPSQVANLNAYDHEAVARIDALAPGELALPVETRQGVAIYRLDERLFDRDKAWQAYSASIREQLLEERLQRYLDERLARGEVQIDDARLAQVTSWR